MQRRSLILLAILLALAAPASASHTPTLTRAALSHKLAKHTTKDAARDRQARDRLDALDAQTAALAAALADAQATLATQQAVIIDLQAAVANLQARDAAQDEEAAALRKWLTDLAACLRKNGKPCKP